MKKIAIIILAALSALSAQGFDGASLGMGGNYLARSRGVDALAWNPANLALPRRGAVEVNLVSLNLGLFNSALSVDSYNRYFTFEGHNGQWSRSDRKDILDMFSGDGLRLNGDVKTNIFGLAIGNFGYALQVESSVAGNVKPGKPLEMFLFGETVTTDYRINEQNVANVRGYSALKHGVGYGHLFKLGDNAFKVSNLTVGLALNFYQGLAVAQTQQSSISVERVQHDAVGMDEEVFRSELRVSGRTADASGGSAGSGFGLDIGATAHYNKNFLFSFALNNLFGNINWTGNTQQVTKVSVDSSHAFSSNVADTSYSYEEETEGATFKTSLPVTMRLGAQWRFNKSLSLTADYHQGLNKAFGNSTVPQVGVGAEYYPWGWLPLRGGMTVGGKHGFLFAVGTGIHAGPLLFDFSYAMSKALLPAYSTGVFTSFNLKLRF